MKVVILAGGMGTRMGSETLSTPKPMIEVGGKPIIWHIMKTYAYYGHKDFIICLGYKGNIIKDYFLDYAFRQYDCTVNFEDGSCQLEADNEEHDWKVTLVDTGLNTQTGGRIKRVAKYLGTVHPFLATYGDGVADIDLEDLVDTHLNEDRYATLTSVHSKSKFGVIETDGQQVTSFEEKATTIMINGGFFVFEPTILNLIQGDDDPLEAGLLKTLTGMGELTMYEHKGFWQCMDSPKEVATLNTIWDSGKIPWKVW